MTKGEGKTGGVVIKVYPQPRIRHMAHIARRREVGADVVWTGRLLKIFQVTGGTSGREAFILANGCALVTFLARHGGVRPEQGKSILVIFDLLRRDLPAKNGVTLRTVRAHFSAMNIGVAVLASLADVSEHSF